MSEFPGVQDVFCGPETVVHFKRGSALLEPEAIQEALARHEVVSEGIRRDDSAML